MTVYKLHYIAETDGTESLEFFEEDDGDLTWIRGLCCSNLGGYCFYKDDKELFLYKADYFFIIYSYNKEKIEKERQKILKRIKKRNIDSL